MDLNTATTYRHGREDVLVGLARLERLIHGAEDATPLRLGQSNGRDADVWNLRVVLEELTAQMEEQTSPGSIRVNVRPEVDAEALGDLASDLAEAVAARIVDKMHAGPGGILPAPPGYETEHALELAVQHHGHQGIPAGVVVETARAFRDHLVGQTATEPDLGDLGAALAAYDADGTEASLEELLAEVRALVVVKGATDGE